MASLNLASPTDRFEDTALSSDMRSITVQVFNGGVYYQLLLAPGDHPGGGAWLDPEGTFLGPGYWNFDDADFRGMRCRGIRFRRAGTTTPATVVSASGA